MKFPQLSSTNALLLVLGLVLAMAGFAIDQPLMRTLLQVVGVCVLAASVWLGQQLTREGQEILDES